MIDAEFVRSILDYDSETGVFTWKARPREHFKTDRDCNAWNKLFAGRDAVGPPLDYVKIRINYKRYLAHRLAWLWVTGEWPKDKIDHRDGDRSNNRFANLRETTHSENMCNRGAQSNNVSGIKGVSWHVEGNKWQARICVRGSRTYLGLFDSIDAAAAAYARAALELHGEFARAE